ncbi:glycoside hydrolase family 16 protein [Laetiporus sulphureus 93-53]|uniref:Glycoside hydrolase family 16 protein n=1 Tax=Laetiporus sulphureus 93-53 TaxID=1314785 RepID=A0A165EL70_9APHY|nr:glycoside hydrolase family 16 protein [Laetiporus sulphureus 93-53]KZT07290.1 glycoside hydrolase family 16 protein [Laetiporus sulphureus 93-53]
MMHSAFAALILALPLTSLARHEDGALRRRHHNVARSSSNNGPTYMRRDSNYTLQNKFVGEDFLDWNFYDAADPTSGLVDYLDEADAVAAGLASVDCNNVTTLKIDNTETVAAGGLRKSVRISSPETYNGGLFIADFAAMPYGCGIWPAYWTVSATATWPAGGEMDIIEGVNLMTQNQITLHTGDTCTLNSTAATTGSISSTTCTSSADADSGCAYTQPGTNSFGAGFNAAGGGVFAHLWNSDGITVWFFTRDAIPSDVAGGTPDPTSWGTPTAIFPDTGCDISASLYDHTIVLDTTICGDWAGAVYSTSGCPGTCDEIVANATNFDSECLCGSIPAARA